MVERPRGLGFLLETAQTIRVLRERCGKDFDRHRPLQPRVFRLVHLPHPPRAKRRQDLVRAEACAGGESHGMVRILRSKMWLPPSSGVTSSVTRKPAKQGTPEQIPGVPVAERACTE